MRYCTEFCVTIIYEWKIHEKKKDTSLSTIKEAYVYRRLVWNWIEVTGRDVNEFLGNFLNMAIDVSPLGKSWPKEWIL